MSCTAWFLSLHVDCEHRRIGRFCVRRLGSLLSYLIVSKVYHLAFIKGCPISPEPEGHFIQVKIF